MGLPACIPSTGAGCVTIINQNGGTNLPKTNTGWDQEQALDLDMVSSMCPNCHILLVQASSSSYTNLSTAVNTAAARGALVISNSYGGSEGSNLPESAYNHTGVAITASAGDSGYGAQFPATSPHVIAVGGTSLSVGAGGTYGSEKVWSGTGSGCSALFAQPSWQQPKNSNMGNNTLCTNRMEADVSAVADPNTGVAVYGPPGGTRSAWMVFGGTSVAAPLIGGIIGEKGVAQTYASGIYAAGSSAFHDVTSGSNGNCGLGYYCNAETGYDGPTGLGTPNGDAAF
jgi:subtilase family serine protease